MEVPARKLRKSDLVWLSEHNCRHSHSYISHYACFITEAPDTAPLKEKVGIFDLESTGLYANWAHMLCWCMKDLDSGKIISDLVTKREIRDKNDRGVIQSAVKEIGKYDRIVTWYGMKFDIPFVRTKAMKYGIEFPAYKDLYHTDLWYMSRSKMRLHSNRLQSFCEYLGIPCKAHRMTPELNEKCQAGDEESLKIVLLHCEEDVSSTGDAYVALLRHMMLQKRSI